MSIKRKKVRVWRCPECGNLWVSAGRPWTAVGRADYVHTYHVPGYPHRGGSHMPMGGVTAFSPYGTPVSLCYGRAVAVEPEAEAAVLAAFAVGGSAAVDAMAEWLDGDAC